MWAKMVVDRPRGKWRPPRELHPGAASAGENEPAVLELAKLCAFGSTALAPELAFRAVL